MGRFWYETSDGSTYKLLLENAKMNRRYMTPAESALWECLRNKNLGVRFRRQHPVFNYIPDFVCLEKQLVVEVDGGYHFIGNQQVSDDERTQYLNQYGFEVIRFTNDEVLGNIDEVLDRIKKVINNSYNMATSAKTNPQATPLLGRGRGRLIIVSAPSGSGKSTIVNWLMKEHPELHLNFSQHNEFLEYEEVYENRFYGTLKQQVENQREAGQNVVFDVDVKGGVNIKKYYGEAALSLFIQPPSVEELRRRLEGRGTDTPEAIEQRLAKAEYELTFASQFDRIIINDDLETAKQETLKVLSDFLK